MYAHYLHTLPTHNHTHTQTHAHTYTNTQAHRRMHMRTQAYTHAHTHTHYSRTNTHMNTHAKAPAHYLQLDLASQVRRPLLQARAAQCPPASAIGAKPNICVPDQHDVTYPSVQHSGPALLVPEVPSLKEAAHWRGISNPSLQHAGALLPVPWQGRRCPAQNKWLVNHVAAPMSCCRCPI